MYCIGKFYISILYRMEFWILQKEMVITQFTVVPGKTDNVKEVYVEMRHHNEMKRKLALIMLLIFFLCLIGCKQKAEESDMEQSLIQEIIEESKSNENAEEPTEVSSEPPYEEPFVPSGDPVITVYIPVYDSQGYTTGKSTELFWTYEARGGIEDPSVPEEASVNWWGETYTGKYKLSWMRPGCCYYYDWYQGEPGGASFYLNHDSGKLILVEQWSDSEISLETISREEAVERAELYLSEFCDPNTLTLEKIRENDEEWNPYIRIIFRKQWDEIKTCGFIEVNFAGPNSLGELVNVRFSMIDELEIYEKQHSIEEIKEIYQFLASEEVTAQIEEMTREMTPYLSEYQMEKYFTLDQNRQPTVMYQVQYLQGNSAGMSLEHGFEYYFFVRAGE